MVCCASCHYVCLLYFIHLLEGEGAGGGVGAFCTLLLQLPSVCVWEAGANLNTVKGIVTLHWNQTNLTYNNASEEKKKK